MELLFQSFLEIPVEALSLQGLVQLIFVTGLFICKVMIPAPQKVKSNSNEK